MKEDLLAFIASYTMANSDGVVSYRVGSVDGELTEVDRTSSENPSFLAVHPEGTHLYTANRTTNSVITSVRVDNDTGRLTPMNDHLIGSGGPSYISVDATGSYAFITNPAESTVMMLSINADGQVDETTSIRKHTGSSVDPDRQQEPYPHAIIPGPENRFAYVPDLGTDRIMIYRIDLERGELDSATTPFVEVHDGAGPRHIDIHPTGKYVYVINELDSTISVFNRETETGRLNMIETVGTLPSKYDDENYCADIHVHPSGQWVYGSNRGHDSIAIFAVDSEQGTLRSVGYEPARGEWPRDIAIDPTGEFLFVENQRSNSVITFRINIESGKLTPTGHEVEQKQPLCMQFIQTK